MAELKIDNPKLVKDFEALREQCSLLWQSYNTYNNLFREQTLLDKVAREFFRDVGILIRKDYILLVCRLTDPATTNVGGDNRENISIKLINNQLDDEQLKNKPDNKELSIEEISEKLFEYGEKIKPARNKIIAHTDREILFGDDHLGATSKEELTDFLDNIQKYCDAVGNIIGVEPLDFSDGGDTSSDLSYLLLFLDRCIKLMPFLKKMLKDEDLKKHLKSIQCEEKNTQDFTEQINAVRAIQRVERFF